VWMDIGGDRSSSSSSSGSSMLATQQQQRPLVVLDTEGLESVARGEGSHLFDRQLSALAVTAADVIILNLWARDIRGGRMGGELHAALLQTLVQRTTTVTTTSRSVSMTENEGEKKKGKEEEGREEGGITTTTTTTVSKMTKRRRTLVVVLRDSEQPEGDVAGARGIVTRCLEEAYAALGQTPPSSSPSSSSSSSSSTFKGKKLKKKKRGKEEEEEGRGGLDVRVVALPSKEFQPVEFGEAVNELRRTLLLFDQDSPSTTAAAAGEGPKTKATKKTQSSSSSRRLLQPVPLPQFPSFAAELWASIIQDSAGGMVGDGSPSSLPSSPSSSSSGEEAIQAFIRRKVVESCVSEAEKQIERLERKVEAANSEMPILEYGRDADSIITTALKSLRARLPSSAAVATTAAESEVIASLTRRLAPSFRQHLDALHEFYFAKFQDRFIGLFLPLRALDREAKSLTKDVSTAFQKAATTAVPPSVGRGTKGGREGWEWEGALERLRDEMDLEVADRRMEVEVLFPGEEELEMGKSRILRRSWWKKVVLKAAVLYINYLQTMQAAQGMARAARRRQEKYPVVPMF